jgi:diguanylate cyclase (GGDEF)-like protein/PAS domain S-box-containing protein
MSDRFLQRPASTTRPETDVETRLLYAAYERKPMNVLMTFGATFVITALLWRLFPSSTLTLWAAAILIVAALGYLECRAFQHAAPASQKIAGWKTLFLFQSTLAGATWAIGPSLMIPTASGIELTLFVAILLAVCSVATTSMAEQRTAMMAFVSAVTAPPAFMLWNRGGELESLVGLALLFGMVLSVFVGRRLNQSMRDLMGNQVRTRAILDTALDAIIEINAQGRITDWNQRAQALFGWARSDALGLALDETIIPQRDRQAFQNDLNGSIARRSEYVLNRRTERTAMRKDGSEFPVEMAVTPLQSGTVWHFSAFIADITERKLAEAKVRDSEERYRTLIEWSPEAMVVHCAGQVVFANPAAVSLFGAERERDLLGKPTLDLVHPDYREAISNRVNAIATGGGSAPMVEVKYLKLDGTVIDVEVQGKSITYDGRPAILGAMRDITARKQAQEALQENREKYRALSEAASEAIFISEQGRCLEQNSQAQEMFGYSNAEAVGRLGTDWIDPVDRDRVMKNMLSGYELPYEVTALRKDGSTFAALLHGKMMHYKGKVVRVTTMADLTERKQAEEAQRIAATAFESQQGMFITNAEHIILRVNRSFTEITGYHTDDVLGRSPRLLASGRHDAAFYAAMWAEIESKGSWQGELWNRRKSGDLFPEWLSISAVKNSAGEATHYVAVFTDITSRKSAEDQIQSLAFYDALTGLPNRRLLLDRIEQALTSSARRRQKHALLFIDLDNFKTLNDTFGHFQGDMLLEQVATRLAGCVREGDTVARLGSDEFAVMLADLSYSEVEAATQAKGVSAKIIATLNRPYELAHGEHHSTPSIGVALFGADPQESSDAPLKRAELAMFEAKSSGKNGVSFFDPQMQVEVMNRAAMEADLREAVLTGQFLLHYQAQVVGAGRLTGVEVLLRWQHPQRGLVSPVEFVALAEETGLILPIGQWVLESACRQLAIWSTQPSLAQLSVAVNVSARQFQHEDFVATVQAALAGTGANPRRLKLELTESMLVTDVEGIIAKMNTLKATGVSFSLDDFGTGYSSLSYLKRLPLDQLKIDQSFVRNILTDPNDAAIAKMVIALADSMGLTVIAEGVEIEAQRDFLAHQGCHSYQGYLFSRPLPIEKFEAFALAATLRP